MNAHRLVIRNFSKEGNWDGKELDRVYGIASSGERQGRRGTKRGKCGATDRTKLEIRRASRFPPVGGRGPKGSQIRLLQNIFYCQLPKKTGTKRQQNKNISSKNVPGKLKKRGEPWVESSPVRSRRLRQGTSRRAPCQEGWCHHHYDYHHHHQQDPCQEGWLIIIIINKILVKKVGRHHHYDQKLPC